MYQGLKKICDNDDSELYYTRYTVDPNVDLDEDEEGLVDEEALV